MNKLPMLCVLLASCDVPPSPGGRDTTGHTLCDCHTPEYPPTPDGRVFLLRIAPDTDERAYLGDRWDGLAGEQLGSGLIAVGDLDDDGLWDLSALGEGAVVLRTTDTPGVRFADIGTEPRPLGDIDGDGRIDFGLVDFGGTSVLPGADLAAGGSFVLGDGWPVTPESVFGSPAPDFDLDGLADTLWVQSDLPDSEGLRLRLVYGAAVDGEVSLATAAVTWVVPRGAINGGGSRDLGDVNGDGVRDLGVREYVETGRGRLTVYSGAALRDGRPDELGVILSPAGETPQYRMFDVVPLGDLDLDGTADLAVTWNEWNGAEVARIIGGDEIGTGDIDQIGTPIPLAGRLTVIDGRDLDGDGLSELLVHDVDARTGAVFRGADLAAGQTEPGWRYWGATGAVLSGLAPDGSLVVWATDVENW